MKETKLIPPNMTGMITSTLLETAWDSTFDICIIFSILVEPISLKSFSRFFG
jgi:hypothetical protein